MGRLKGSKNKKYGPSARAVSRIGEVWKDQTITGIAERDKHGVQLFIVEDSKGRVSTKTYTNTKQDYSCAVGGGPVISEELHQSRIGEVWKDQTIIGLAGRKGSQQVYIVEDTMGRVKEKFYDEVRSGFSCGDMGGAESKKIRPYEAIYNLMVRTANKRNIECTLTYEDYFAWANSNAVCHYSGIPIPWLMHYTKGCCQAYFIDRKDSSKGYTLENCVPCLSEHNVAKGSMSYEYYMNKLNG